MLLKANRELFPQRGPFLRPHSYIAAHCDLAGLRHNLVERPLGKTLLKKWLWGRRWDPLEINI